MATPIFITGIGTGVGKTLAAAIVTEALQADYWKPVQTGVIPGGQVDADAPWILAHLSNPISRILPERYVFPLPASPHLAARKEGAAVDIEEILEAWDNLPTQNDYVVVEGAGGLMVPLNEQDFMADLALRLGAKVILVSRRYLGSINHTLLTARACREAGLDVVGWIFNGYQTLETEELTGWSRYPMLGNIPETDNTDVAFVRRQADQIGEALRTALLK